MVLLSFADLCANCRQTLMASTQISSLLRRIYSDGQILNLLPSDKKLRNALRVEKRNSKCSEHDCKELASNYTNHLCSRHILDFFRKGWIDIHAERGIVESYETSLIVCRHHSQRNTSTYKNSAMSSQLLLDLKTDGGQFRPAKESSASNPSLLAVCDSGQFSDWSTDSPYTSLLSSDLAVDKVTSSCRFISSVSEPNEHLFALVC